MADARDFANDYRNRAAALRANRTAETLTITLDLIGQIRLRIQTEGEDYQNTPFAPYVPGYAKQRARAGYQVGHVDFTRTGALMRSIQPQVIKEDQDSTTIEVAPRGADNEIKAIGAVRKRGNITLPSDDEIAIAAESNTRRLKKYLGI